MELAGARGRGLGGTKNSTDSTEKKAGRMGKLTGATKSARTARNGELRAEIAAEVFCACARAVAKAREK